MIKTIAVCSTGDTWDVCAWDEAGDAVDEPVWCTTKAEAIKVARQMFSAASEASRLIVERKGMFEFQVIRERAAAR